MIVVLVIIGLIVNGSALLHGSVTADRLIVNGNGLVKEVAP